MKSSFSGIFSQFPQAKEALWESVLSLWRLKITAPDREETEDDVLWAGHVSAWLVSVSLRCDRECLADLEVDSFVTATSAGT